LKDLEPGEFDNIVPSGIAAIFSLPGGLKGTYLHHYPATNPYLITQVSGRIVYEKYLADLEAAINRNSENVPLIVDILNCENGCNMGPGCINHQRSVDEVQIAIARRAEGNLQKTSRAALDTFLDAIIPANYHYDHYQDLSNNHQIKIPTAEELAAIYEAMLKGEPHDFRNCGACGYNSCSRMAVAIYNGLNKAQNCHLYQEKTLRNDQKRFQTIAREIAHAFTEVQSSATELSRSTGLTLNNFTEVISNIGSFRDLSVEMAEQAENLTPFVQTISLIARALQEQLNFLQQMIDTVPTPIFFRDTDGVFQGCNKAFEAAVGQPRGSIVGKHLDRILPVDLAEKYREMDIEMMKNPEIIWSENEFDADGIHRNVIINQAPFYNMDGELLGVVGVNVDITEHKQMEQEVMRLDRLRVVGEMAAGIAHEVRNPMTTVRGFLQMMMGQPDTAGYLDYYEMMIQELDSANGIISEFLSLARDKAVDLKLQNLNSIIETLGPLLNAQALNQDKWVNIVAGEIPDSYLDAQQTRQLIINLARNGLEAMQSGGVLTISTYSTDQEVVLVVADQGHGINPEILPKLGTPFFTTKEQGTGLGLAVCYSIVTRHNASIDVETSHDGTAFIIKFPRRQTVSPMI
ncbi:MAG: ATP-binding protein, partial [Methylocystaceae bacterium]